MTASPPPPIRAADHLPQGAAHVLEVELDDPRRAPVNLAAQVGRWLGERAPELDERKRNELGAAVLVLCHRHPSGAPARVVLWQDERGRLAARVLMYEPQAPPEPVEHLRGNARRAAEARNANRPSPKLVASGVLVLVELQGRR